MRIGIFGTRLQPENIEYIKILIHKLETVGASIHIYTETLDFIKPQLPTLQNQCFSSHSDIRNTLDFMIALGGDGNILAAITLIRDSNIPIIGINLGRLGFLASINKELISNAIDALARQEYKLETRRLIQLKSPTNLFGDFNYALNEISIYKKFPNSLISIKAKVDEQYLNTYWADGLLVATPTGSTAYSLSSGGPILHPELHNFIISPIAAHNLSVRPVVISDESTIELEVSARSNALVSLDARTVEVNSGTILQIGKANFAIQFVRLPEENFFKTVRNKLLWGIDNRN